MKKTINIILIFLMTFTLFGCGSSENDELVTKYKTIIDALETEDYEKVLEEVQVLADSKKLAEKEEYQEITITLDNFGEYFELVPATVAIKNDFNEFDYCGTCVGLKIKDAYIDRIYEDESHVTCDVIYSIISKECDYDLATATISNIRDDRWSDNSSQEQRTIEYEFKYNKIKKENRNYTNPENIVYQSTRSVTAWNGNSGSGDLFAGADRFSFYEISNISLERVAGTIYIK